MYYEFSRIRSTRNLDIYREETEKSFMFSMDVANVTGLLAGALTTIAFLPQLIHTWKTRSTKDVSLGMFLTFTTGVFLWIVYGMLINSVPVVAANAVTFILAAAILVFKLRYG